MRSFLAAALLGLIAVPASAQGYHGGYLDNFGIGALYRTLDFPTERRVPYFAAHPPVYYSVPVPRTYGHSPFAYGPWARTPEVAPVEPMVIKNPHVDEASNTDKSAQAGTSRTDRNVSTSDAQFEVTQSGPLTVVNPFVTPQAEEVEYH